MKNNTKKLALAGFFIALAQVLPIITGHIPEIGSMLSPMHLPILLCGFICGPKYGALAGFASPLLKTAIYSIPPLYPIAIAMSLELMIYGLVTGLVYSYLRKSVVSIYISLISAMVLGRVTYGIITAILLFAKGGTYSFNIFVTSTILGSLPGIILQLVLIPIVIVILDRKRV